LCSIYCDDFVLVFIGSWFCEQFTVIGCCMEVEML